MRSLLEQCVAALAFAGDLSMGQPVEHSPTTGLIAAAISDALGFPETTRRLAAQLGFLRWAGCTANAREFSELFGDDVGGRAELLASRNPFVSKHPPAGDLDGFFVPLANTHCDAMRELARRLGLEAALLSTVGDLFESWDGSGFPRRKRGEEIALPAQLVALAGDLEVFSRLYGPARTSLLIEERGGRIYDPALARLALRQVLPQLDGIRKASGLDAVCQAADFEQGETTAMEDLVALLADYGDLKRPDRVGVSRRAATLAQAMAKRCGLGREAALRLERAALLHGLGRVSVPNAVLERVAADDESERLVPYWTERILSRMPALEAEAWLASLAFERLDGCGYHRGLKAPAIPVEARLLQVAVILAELHYASEGGDWQKAAARQLDAGVADGSLDAAAARAGTEALGIRAPEAAGPAAAGVTEREADVLKLLARGLSNKQIARSLEISPSTAGTHVENLYRKLEVSSRAAAVLRAFDLGLLA